MLDNLSENSDELYASLADKRRANVISLLRSGLTPAVISQRLSVCLATVNEDIQKHFASLRKESTLAVSNARLLEIDRLCHIEETLQPAVDACNFKAIQLRLMVMKAKSDLLGLYSFKEEVHQGFPEDLDWQDDKISSTTMPQLNKLKTTVADLSDDELTTKYFEIMKASN